MALIHGGQRLNACACYGGAVSDWLDLSTGIAPWSYPLPAVPESIWQRLPEKDDGLEDSASCYYHVDKHQILPVSGSQWAIEQIPRLYSDPLRVGLLTHSYAEHAKAWKAAGHCVSYFDTVDDLCSCVSALDAVVLVVPNNPLGDCISEADLCYLQLNLGVMVVDLAFADGSALPKIKLEANTWLLRSVGKFFGLAGIRLGFVIATTNHCQRLAQQQPPWSVSHLARWAGKQALIDQDWQAQQKNRLIEQSRRLQQRLAQTNLIIIARTHYFITVTHPQAELIIQSALRRYLLLRYFPEFKGIRFGLPKTEEDWSRLEDWLEESKCLL